MGSNIIDPPLILTAWLKNQAEKAHTGELAVSISHHDKIILDEVYGRKGAHDDALNKNHLFNIGSLAKMFTATAILQLAEQNKIDLSERASSYLPWIKNHTDVLMAEITIDMLLKHRGGLVRDGVNAGFWQLEAPFPDAKTLQKIILENPIIKESYKKFKYSNLGYALLGQIIEVVSGQSYPDFITRSLLKPLGLKNTHVGLGQSFKHEVAAGYTRFINGKSYTLPGAVDTRAFTSTTGYYSCAADICRFLIWHFSSDDKLLQSRVRHKMHQGYNTRSGTSYGRGFMTYELLGKKITGHGGGFLGHRSYAFYSPQNKLGIVIISSSKERSIAELPYGIMDILNLCLRKSGTEYKEDAALKKFDNLQLINLWNNIVTTTLDKKLLACSLDETLPITNAEELSKMDSTAFKIDKASAISSPRETVKFEYVAKKLKIVNYAGQVLRPELVHDLWLKENF